MQKGANVCMGNHSCYAAEVCPHLRKLMISQNLKKAIEELFLFWTQH